MIPIGIIAQGGAVVPAAVTDLSATQTDNNIGYLSWTAPTNTGGAPIIEYRVVSNPDSYFPEYPPIDTTTSYTSLSISQQHGTNYNYTVYAINVIGQGPGANTSATFVSFD